MDNDITPESIKALRGRLGLTQPAFADLLNSRVAGLRVDRISVNRWERGRVTPGGVCAMAIRALTEAPEQSIAQERKLPE